MNHKSYLDHLQSELDGALTPEQRRQLDEHLAACGECQAARQSLAEVERLFRAAPPVQPRAGFTARFRARQAQRRSRPRLLWGGLVLGLSAVGSAALVMPLGVSLLVSAARAAQQPAASAALFTGLDATLSFAGAVADALFIVARALAGWAWEHPYIGLLALLGAAAAVVWLYVIRKLSLKVVLR